jgi:hypothetical protein
MSEPTRESAVQRLARNLQVPADLIQDAIEEVVSEAIWRHDNPDY